MVTCAMEKGRIEVLEMRSQVGEGYHLRNPWPGNTGTLYRDRKKREDLSGMLLAFATGPGEIVIAVSGGSTPS